MCFASPFVSCPSGQVTTMSAAWLSDRRVHFWFENTSKSSVSNVASRAAQASACGGLAVVTPGVRAVAANPNSVMARSAATLVALTVLQRNAFMADLPWLRVVQIIYRGGDKCASASLLRRIVVVGVPRPDHAHDHRDRAHGGGRETESGAEDRDQRGR